MNNQKPESETRDTCSVQRLVSAFDHLKTHLKTSDSITKNLMVMLLYRLQYVDKFDKCFPIWNRADALYLKQNQTLVETLQYWAGLNWRPQQYRTLIQDLLELRSAKPGVLAPLRNLTRRLRFFYNRLFLACGVRDCANVKDERRLRKPRSVNEKDKL